MLNKFMGIGNLTNDPELKKINGDKSVCKFSVAINNRVNETVTYIDVETWNKSAENCKRFLSKGRRVLVEGRLQLNRWKAQSGESRSKLFCVADLVTFLDKSEDPKTAEQPEKKTESPATDSPAEETDEFADIPF